MGNKQNSEQAWVEQALRSLEGRPRAVPSPWLYQQVRHRLETQRASARDEAPTQSWVLARVAFVVVLVAANLVTFAHRTDFTQPTSTATTTPEYAYSTLGGAY